VIYDVDGLFIGGHFSSVTRDIREVAESVLFGQSLDEKLAVGKYRGIAPAEATDHAPECGVSMPDLPARPPELNISERGASIEGGKRGKSGGKSAFPKVNRMDEMAERGKMLHFLANHELLATELMALVLLKFPHAPAEFRAGVYETMREEQAHTLMYMRRMRECGMEFGELPVNDYFWRMVAPMECPMDFVSRLSLVFEQANLDYSLHYGRLFREVGDTGTAVVLEKIYQDEIGHVGHGLKWFRKWKDEGLTDWSAFRKQLHFPLTLARAKGMAPYDREGRIRAGIDREWVDALEVVEQSRGRTPIVHWFNPNEELVMAEDYFGKMRSQPRRKHLMLQEDLAVLPLAWARRDDVVIVKQLPSREHVLRLKRNGFVVPEFVLQGSGEEKELLERKIGGLKPWAWGPEACDVMKPFVASIPAKVQWGFRKWKREDASVFSKRCGLDLAKLMGEEVGVWCCDLDMVERAVSELFKAGDGVLLKAPWSNAGRGHLRLGDEKMTVAECAWVRRVLAKQGGVVVEQWLKKVLDFSVQYEVGSNGAKMFGVTRVMNDAAGRYLGTLLHHKWTSGLDSELSRFLLSDSRVMEFYKEELPKYLAEVVDGNFRGNVGIDAMLYRDHGELELRKVVEINPRMTMGRVALELFRHFGSKGAGYFQILRKSKLGDVDEWIERQDEFHGSVNGSRLRCALNDPRAAEEFIAVWNLSSTVDEVMQMARS